METTRKIKTHKHQQDIKFHIKSSFNVFDKSTFSGRKIVQYREKDAYNSKKKNIFIVISLLEKLNRYPGYYRK